MKIFRTLFDLVSLPVDVAVDSLTAFNDLAEDEKIFKRTQDRVKTLDEDLGL